MAVEKISESGVAEKDNPPPIKNTNRAAMNNSGGARPRAGRPPGTMNHRTKALRQLTDEVIKAGVTPLEVMLNQMREYVAEAEKIKIELAEQSASAPKTKTSRAAREHQRKVEEIRSRLMAFRDGAMDRAVQAAPYVHPRLASMSLTNDDKKPVRVLDPHVTIEVKQQVFLDQIRDLRRGLPAAVEYDEKPVEVIVPEKIGAR